MCKCYIKHLKKNNSNEFDSQIAIALFYIRLKLYDIAVSVLENIVKENPDEPECYYYLALANIKGRRIKVIPMTEIKSIIKYIDAAIAICDVPKYYYFKAIVYYDYYYLNSLRPSDGDFRTIINQAKGLGILSSDELMELRDNIIITDNIIFLLN